MALSSFYSALIFSLRTSLLYTILSTYLLPVLCPSCIRNSVSSAPIIVWDRSIQHSHWLDWLYHTYILSSRNSSNVCNTSRYHGRHNVLCYVGALWLPGADSTWRVHTGAGGGSRNNLRSGYITALHKSKPSALQRAAPKTPLTLPIGP